MTEEQLIQDYEFDPVTAAKLARLIELAQQKRPTVPPALRLERIAALPDLAGTMRIEGLQLTRKDLSFHAFIYGLGLDDGATDALILAYARAIYRRDQNKALAAE
jgi:hypothetical protein